MAFIPKSQDDYLKEIAEKINNATKYEIDNPTLEDIKNLKEHDYIIIKEATCSIMIRRKYTLDAFLGIPTVMWYNGYEMGDNVMGMIPEMYSAEEVLEALKDYKEEGDKLCQVILE